MVEIPDKDSPPVNDRLVSLFKIFSRIDSIIVVLVGLVILIGWILDNPTLKSVIPGLTAMNPATAICFILSGLSLVMQNMSISGKKALHLIAKVCAFLIILIALIKLFSFLGYDVGVDRIMFREKLETYIPPNRMAPNTTLNFLLVGLSLLILGWETRRGYRPAEFLILPSFIISLFALIGYAYGVASFYRVAFYIPMALNTAAAFALINVGVLCARPERGLMAVVTSLASGGIVARRLLPVAIGIPLLWGALALWGTKAGLYYIEFGISLVVLLGIITLTVIIWQNANLLNKIDFARRRAEEGLRQAIVKLQELDRLKSMFIASMSHELRTPLNSIIGFTGIILQGMAGEINEEQRKQLTMVKSSAGHLLNLINDVIDVSKIEAEKIQLTIEEFDLSRVVKEIKDSFAVAVEEKALKLSAEMPDKAVIKSDERRTKQIIMNLVSNAIKFTEKGEIGIRVTGNGNSVAILVKDTGIGIKEEDMPRLFKQFSRIMVEGQPLQEGTGLGLYLSQKLARVLGGEIKAASEFGKGSEFTLTLPLAYKGG